MERKKKLLQEAGQSDKEILFKKYEENFLVRYTYESNSMEGNTLTLAETKVVLLDGMAVAKPLAEVQEAWQHRKAFEYAKKSIKEGMELDKDTILKISHLAMDIPVWDSPYRTGNVYITGTTYEPPDSKAVAALMERFYQEIVEKAAMCDMPEGIHPITLAALTHAEFVHIHPYPDFNGRTARLLMNYQLMKHGFLAVSVSKEQILRYYNALDAYHFTGDLKPFEQLIARLEEEELDKLISDLRL